MTPSQIDCKISEMIVERLFLDISPEQIKPEKSLTDYGVDSFLLLEIVVALEEEFSIRVEPGDITSESLRSVSTLRKLVCEKIG